MSKGCALQAVTWKDVDPLKVNDKYDYFMLDPSGGYGDRDKISYFGWLNYYGKSIIESILPRAIGL